MDRRERTDNGQAAMLAALQGLQATIWTALPGIIQSFDPAKRTCTVQPALSAKAQNKDGSWRDISLPLLLDCPVVFPGGGGFVLTFPLAAGDECLVVFASRCIDSWWQSGGQQVQAEVRFHDLSDGFVIPGPRSVPAVEPAISTTKVQLRNASGSAHVEIDAAGDVGVVSPANITASAGGNISATAAGAATVTAPTITLNGNVTINGTLTQAGGGAANFSGSITAAGNITGQGTSLHTHVHTDPQGGNTGPPV